MQLRVKRRGQSWEQPGLLGILTVRALVLSERWDTAWKIYEPSIAPKSAEQPDLGDQDCIHLVPERSAE